MLKRLLAIAVAAAGMVGLLLWSQHRSEPLHVSGIIEAHEIRIGSRVGGRVSQVLVSEGQAIRSGAVLVELEPFQLRELLAQAGAQLEQVTAVRDRVKSGFRVEEVAQAKARHDQLAATVEKLVNGPRKEDIGAAKSPWELAESQLSLAKLRHKRIADLFVPPNRNAVSNAFTNTVNRAQQVSQLLGVSLSFRITRPFAESLPVVPSRDPTGHVALPIEMRSRLLYNPDLESSHFFVPGLVGIILQLVTLFLTSFAIVRERELGTLEQLFVTPVGRVGLLMGKLVPYACIGTLEMVIVLTVMVFVFGVPIHGSLFLLMGLSMLFIICALALGLLVSTLARTQLQAMQFAFLLMLPTVLLSGFMFPRGEMPLPIYAVSFAIPATYFLEILRGIILRGADLTDLVPQVVGLTVCCLAIMALSLARFRKQLA